MNLPVEPVFTGFITSVGILLICFIIGLYVIYGKGSNKLLVIFGLAWFLGFSLPNMFVRLSSADDSVEYLLHRMYLPSVGFIIMFLGFLPERWFDLLIRQNRVIIASLIGIFLVLNILQQRKYNDGISYWSSAVEYAPDRAWFHYFRGRYYFKQQDFVTYEKYLRKADSIKSYPIFKYNLGMVYSTAFKDYDKAFTCFSDAFKAGYYDEDARKNFVVFCIESSYEYFKNKEYDKAIARCQIALNNDPVNSVAAYNMGIYLINKGEKTQAAAMWRRALKNKPDMKDACKSLCLYYHYDAKNEDSARYFNNIYKSGGGTENLLNTK